MPSTRFYRITADEGVLALWKGCGPTVVRAMALNMGMLASYDQSAEYMRDYLGLGETSTVVGKLLFPQNLLVNLHLQQLLMITGVCCHT